MNYPITDDNERTMCIHEGLSPDTGEDLYCFKLSGTQEFIDEFKDMFPGAPDTQLWTGGKQGIGALEFKTERGRIYTTERCEGGDWVSY